MIYQVVSISTRQPFHYSLLCIVEVDIGSVHHSVRRWGVDLIGINVGMLSVFC